MSATRIRLPEPSHSLIDGMPVRHMGQLDADRVLVIVGRSNHRKPCDALDALAFRLHEQHGVTLCWFASRRTETMKSLDLAFERRFGPALAHWCEHDRLAGRALRKMLYAGLLLARPAQWRFFPALLRFTHAGSARDLRRFLRTLPARKLLLIGHSAGGIVASLAADVPRVSHVIALGYPFRHPARGEEPARTRHLAAIAKPLLILQGESDEYGSACSASRYGLSAAVHVAAVRSDHNYDQMAGADLQGCGDLLEQFLANAIDPDQTRQNSSSCGAAAMRPSRA